MNKERARCHVPMLLLITVITNQAHKARTMQRIQLFSVLRSRGAIIYIFCNTLSRFSRIRSCWRKLRKIIRITDMCSKPLVHNENAHRTVIRTNCFWSLLISLKHQVAFSISPFTFRHSPQSSLRPSSCKCKFPQWLWQNSNPYDCGQGITTGKRDDWTAADSEWLDRNPHRERMRV